MAGEADDDVWRLAAHLIRQHLTRDDIREGERPEKIGPCTILRAVREGPTGRWFLARHPDHERVVVVKQLPPGTASDAGVLAALRALDDAGIVRTLDGGVADGRPFLVLENVAGPVLSDVALSLDEGVRVLEAVAKACHAAHEKGVVHGALSPLEIFVGESPRVAGFGAAAFGEMSELVEYRAPEQVEGGAVGPWTDVHALGVLLYELLTDRTPFEGGSPREVLDRIRSTGARAPSELLRGAPAALEKLALQALSKEPRHRPASALELADALRKWRERPTRSTLRGVGPAMLFVAALLAPTPASAQPTPPGGESRDKVGSSRVDLQACKLEYSIVSPK